MNKEINDDMKCLILDFTALSYIDPSGVVMLKNIGEEFKNIQIPIYIAGCSGNILMKNHKIIKITFVLYYLILSTILNKSIKFIIFFTSFTV